MKQTEEKECLKTVNERLLLLYSLEKLRGEDNIETVSMEEATEVALQSLKEKAKDKNITAEIHAVSNSDFDGDSFLVKQAAYSLIENAIDFSPRGSTVMVHILRKDGALQLKVTDQGTGIPEDSLSKIYKPFYSLARPDTGKASHGVGLALVRGIAELHDGFVDIENNSTAGVTATLTIPIKSFQIRTRKKAS